MFTILTPEQIQRVEEYWVEKLTIDQQKQLAQSKWFHSIEWFSDVFLKAWKSKNWILIRSAQFHLEIWEQFKKEGNSNIICPRWHAKTTCTLIYIIHSLIYRTHPKILYIASAGLWEESIGRIREQLENNELIKYVFGELVPKNQSENKNSKKWRQRHLELLNDTVIETIPKGWSVRWRRPNLIVGDDVEEQKDVANRILAEKTQRWFFTALYNTLLPWGKIIMLGTIVGELCLVKYLRDVKKWKTIEYKAINNDKALWEEMWPLEALYKRREELWTAAFNQEFMNIPLLSGESIIKNEWIRRYHDLPRLNKVVCGVDPSLSIKELADFTWIVVGALGNNWKKYILYSENFKGSINQLIDRLHWIYKEFNVTQFLVENVGIIDTLVRANLSKANLPVIGVNPKQKDKATRLREISGQVEFWNVEFGWVGGEELIEQLRLFPDVAHDDLVDGFIYTINWLSSGNYKIIEQTWSKWDWEDDF